MWNLNVIQSAILGWGKQEQRHTRKIWPTKHHRKSNWDTNWRGHDGHLTLDATISDCNKFRPYSKSEWSKTIYVRLNHLQLCFQITFKNSWPLKCIQLNNRNYYNSPRSSLSITICGPGSNTRLLRTVVIASDPPFSHLPRSSVMNGRAGLRQNLRRKELTLNAYVKAGLSWNICTLLANCLFLLPISIHEFTAAEIQAKTT